MRAPPWQEEISFRLPPATLARRRGAISVFCRPGIGEQRNPPSNGSDEGNAYGVLFGLIFVSIFNVGSFLRAEIDHRCDEISVHSGLRIQLLMACVDKFIYECGYG